jgi:hypothetical protein
MRYKKGMQMYTCTESHKEHSFIHIYMHTHTHSYTTCIHTYISMHAESQTQRTRYTMLPKARSMDFVPSSNFEKKTESLTVSRRKERRQFYYLWSAGERCAKICETMSTTETAVRRPARSCSRRSKTNRCWRKLVWNEHEHHRNTEITLMFKLYTSSRAQREYLRCVIGPQNSGFTHLLGRNSQKYHGRTSALWEWAGLIRCVLL